MSSHIIYKIYYNAENKDVCVYVGRTNQPLQSRLRGHFFKKPMQREIDIFLVSKIEFAEVKTEADMFLYEIYYINLIKPMLNKNDKSKETLTISLPDLNFEIFTPPLMDKWKEKISNKDKQEHIREKREIESFERKRELRRLWHEGQISEDEYYQAIEQGDLFL